MERFDLLNLFSEELSPTNQVEGNLGQQGSDGGHLTRGLFATPDGPHSILSNQLRMCSEEVDHVAHALQNWSILW